MMSFANDIAPTKSFLPKNLQIMVATLEIKHVQINKTNLNVV
jgi:hypothetical protein